MELSIATGKSRKTKKWNNVLTSWEALVEKLSSTTRTPETFREYNAYGKEKQADIKDRGGFVGGYLIDGRRTPNNVKFRQLLTLDIDLASADFWETYTLLFSNAALLHSTHKHSPKSPRYRLIIPLDRKVTYDEYEAIGRKVAGYLNINLFDPTTFQPERLMYWPTTSKDGEWVCERQRGQALDTDEILASYENWRDISEWPKGDSEKDYILKSLKQQGDPLEKPGLIGAFCRTYTIPEAIEEFLPDVYETTAFDDRYTYAEGSAAAGAIVYNDVFLYSHHSTDPIHGQLVNAFDLIRLHKFGHEDTDEGEKEITKKHSYKLMNEFAKGIHEVVKQVGIYRLSADEDFADDLETNEWLGELTLDKYHNYDTSIPNFEKIITNDPLLKGHLKYDLFNLREVIVKPVPWDQAEGTFEFEDKDEAGLRHYLENRYGIYNATKTKDALDIVFARNTFHPIRNYIDSLIWDGETRLDKMLIEYQGAEDTPFTRLATRKAFVAAVARIYQPGIKFDYVLTLMGEEGIKKSSLLEKLGGEWFSDSFVGVEGNKAYEQLQGAWLIEMGELSGVKRSDTEAVKHFITKRSDRFRVAYGRRISTFKRQCVFFGTTNEYNFLRENNGNRRFWPVRVNIFGEKEIEDLPVDQIWAEAKIYYDKHEKLYFDADIEEEARIIQKQHTEVDDRAGLISAYLSIPLPAENEWAKMSLFERRAYLKDTQQINEKGDTMRTSVCAAEIWCELFEASLKDMTTYNTKYIHIIMNDMPGWHPHSNNLTFSIYGKQRAYVTTKYGKVLKRKQQIKSKDL